MGTEECLRKPEKGRGREAKKDRRGERRIGLIDVVIVSTLGLRQQKTKGVSTNPSREKTTRCGKGEEKYCM